MVIGKRTVFTAQRFIFVAKHFVAMVESALPAAPKTKRCRYAITIEVLPLRSCFAGCIKLLSDDELLDKVSWSKQLCH